MNGVRAANAPAAWITANLIGFTLGGAAGGAVLRGTMQPYFGVLPPGIEAVRILAVRSCVAATIWGVLIGTAQWAALGRRLRADWWMPATCLGWFLSGLIGGAISGTSLGLETNRPPAVGPLVLVLEMVTGFLLSGLVPSILQWLVLRQRVEGASWWPAASLSGVVVGLSGAFLVVRWGMVDVVSWLRPEDFPSAKALVLIGAVAGTLYGMVTWPLVKRLLHCVADAAAAKL